MTSAGENNEASDATNDENANNADHQTERVDLASGGSGGGEVIHQSPKQSTSSDETNEIKQHSPSSRKSSTTISPPRIDEENIAKAEAFLRNDEIHDLPTKSKRKYLASKAGMTPQEIDVALERVAGKEGMMMGAHDNDDGENAKNKNRSSRSPHDREDNYGRAGQSGSQRHSDDQFRDGQQGHGRTPNNQHYQDDPYRNNHPRGPMEQQRRPPPHHDTPPHDNSNNMQNMQPYPGATETQDMTPSSSFLPAWAGGISLGIFTLAALRWLNGGDFVLFPPPTASEPRGMESTIGSSMKDDEPLSSIHEEDTDESDSQQEEEEDNLPEENAQYDDEEDSRSNEDDELNMILKGTANAQHFHTHNPHPAPNELVLEIRALTSAIHSHRDVQERANRAVSKQVGKGMTDDAMDFLRQKKSEVEVPLQTSGADVSFEGKDIGLTVASMLTEVAGDLSLLKQSILESAGDSDGVGAGNEHFDELSEVLDGAKEADSGDKGEEDPFNQIDEVMEKMKKVLAPNEVDAGKNGNEEHATQIDMVTTKIQKMLAIVGNLNEKGGVDSIDKKSNEAAAVEKESTLSPEPNATSTASPTPNIIQQTDEKTQRSETPPQLSSNETAQTNDQLEEALKTLANNNTPEDLKVGAQMLYLYCLNISKNPSVPRYRKIYTNNKTFRDKVGNLVGATDFLSAVGFVGRTTHFEWAPQSEDASLVTKSRLDFALVALELMKNGSKVNEESKPKEEESVVPLESNEIASEARELTLSSVLSVAGVGKGMELN